MDNTLLVCLSHQIAQQRSLDTLAGNVANLNTAAYKREEMKFEDYLQTGKPSQWQQGPQSVAFVVAAGTVRDMSDGRIESTGNTFDVAINGDGYFVVQTPRGERYTRDGHFTLDAQGQIVTEAGDPVLSDGGPVAIANEDGDITIAADGTVSGDQGQLAKLRIAQFSDPRALTKEGNDDYASSTEPLAAQGGYKLEQGMLERSNVEPVSEMTDLIAVQRSYQTMSNLITTLESLKRTAISKLSTVSSSA